MRLKDLRGQEHPLDLRQYVVLDDDPRERSSGHLRARRILRRLYPTDIILEEVSVPGEHLFLDFFIPKRKLVVEVHGEQHYTQIEFFHKSKIDFLQSSNRDKRKRDWCKTNRLRHVELDYKHDDESWTNTILGMSN